MKLAILSDTHGLLRPEVAQRLQTADVILHAGDINKQSIVDHQVVSSFALLIMPTVPNFIISGSVSYTHLAAIQWSLFHDSEVCAFQKLLIKERFF